MKPVKYKIRERLLPSGNISLVLEISDNGVRTFKSLSMVIVPGEIKENKVKREAAHQIVIKKQQTAYENRYNVDLIDKSGDDFLAWFKENSNHWYNSTYQHLKVYKPKTYLYQVNNKYIQGFAEYLNTANSLKTTLPKPLNQNTCSTMMSRMLIMIAKAQRKGIIGNHITEVKPYDFFKRVKSKKEWLTKVEVQKLVEVPCNIDVVKRGFLFSVYTGIRLGDCVDLAWNNINGNQLSIIMQKTKEPLDITLTPKALEQLNPGRAPLYGLRRNDGYQGVALAHWVLSAGILKKITFHNARHSFAVNALLGGIDIFTLRDLLGHQSVTSTEVYAKVVASMKTEATDKLNDYWA